MNGELIDTLRDLYLKRVRMEVPEFDLHKAIINKLIMNDSQHFKEFFAHIRSQYKKNHVVIKEKYPEFTKIIESFLNQIDQESAKIINIDQYMRDLKRHALAEYKTLYEREQVTNGGSDTKSKRKKKKDKMRKAAAAAAVTTTPPLVPGNPPNTQQMQPPPPNRQQPVQQP
jgi:flagellar motility protein MotE (MotC chaperone)